ncbi:hypothetical protein QTP88_029745 [Uroleucon formosanum]
MIDKPTTNYLNYRQHFLLLCLLIVSIVRNIVRKQFVLVHFIMEIIDIKRGGKKIIFENFVYVKQKLVKVTLGIRWNCIKKSKNNENSCLRSITTDDSIKVIVSTTDHNHRACPVEVEVLKTLSSMKNNAKNHSEPPSIIFSKATINLSNEVKLLMPAENSVKRSLRRIKNASYPPLVPVNKLEVTGIWATTGGMEVLYEQFHNQDADQILTYFDTIYMSTFVCVTMSKTGYGNISTLNELVPKAPSYSELFNTVIELTGRLQKLESTAADHTIKIVLNSSIPVAVLVGRTWLDLPRVNYSKQGGEIVFDSINREQTDALDVSRAHDNVYVSVTEPVYPTKAPITENDIVIDLHVSAAQRETLVALLNEYRDAFAKNITELGCTDVVAMDIAETPDSVPVSLKPYRTSPSDRRIISTTLREWLKAGRISDATSPYASSIPLTPEAKDKTAFVIEKATAKFERMPFGLKGAPGTFQKLMSIVFKDLKSDGVISTYFGDIILPSKSWDLMMLDLRRVLSALRAANLMLKPSKCTFGSCKLDYLGFRISEGQRTGREGQPNDNTAPQYVHLGSTPLGREGEGCRAPDEHCSEQNDDQNPL